MSRRVRRAAIAAFTVAVWVCAPGAAVAQAPARTIAVVDATAGATGDPQVTDLVGRIDTQLDKEADLAAVASDRRPALVGGVPDDRRSATTEARSALVRARDAFARFDQEDAIAEADRGIKRAVELPPDPEISKLIADLAFVRGRAGLGAKRPDDAAADFALVHRLDAGRTLDPVKYPPELVTAFDTARTAAELTSLDVEAPAGAEVWVDGVSVGAAPATVALSAGLHVVTVTGSRLVTRGQVVDVPAGGSGLEIRVDAAEASSTMIVHRLRRALADAASADERAEAVAALVRAVGAQDAVVVGRDDAGELAIRIYSGRTGVLGDPEPGKDVDPAALLAPLRPIRRPVPLDLGLGPEVPIATPTPWYRRRWFQATVGGTIVVGVVSAIVVSLTRPEGMGLFPGGEPGVEGD